MACRLLLLCFCMVSTAACGRVGLELIVISEAEDQTPHPHPADSEPPQYALDAGPLCELNTVEHCGSCEHSCDASQFPNVAAMTCSSAECAIAACTTGFGDCDGLLDNGCERMLSTLLECGACGMPCDIPHALASCDSGTCAFVSCETGYGDCDGLVANGCETLVSTLENCGGCGAVCQLPGPAMSSCTGGRCTSASCSAPFADCDGDSLSCETNLQTLNSCGACGVPCGAGGKLPHATASCSTGSCGIASCDSNYGNCDNAPANGCERALTTLGDCGGCGRACALAHATSSCGTGTCALGACMSGWGNCDSNAGTGCETALNTVSNCGGCGVMCSADQACQSGRCVGQFSYPPGNVNPGAIDPTTTSDSTLNCGPSQFDTTTLAFSNWCGTPPTPVIQAQPGGVDLVILPFGDFSISAGASLRVVGNRPLAIVALGNAAIAGSIDVSAAGDVPGPGANQSCGSSTGGNGSGSSSTGGGGGGGAGLGTQGGAGGYGDSSGNEGSRGAARGNATITPLLAGCAGGQGGGCSAVRAAGGGALQISATGRLDVAAPIRALGADGSAGCGSEGGGNGGGSGGSILLEGNQLTVRAGAALSANGGRGGNGGNGGSGGNGGTGSAAAQNGANASANGGGGGGGAFGRIRLHGSSQCTLSVSTPGATTSCP